jgi:hypothetical protein
MTRVFLALGAAAVALTAVPAGARTYSNVTKCAKWRDDRCVQWNVLTNGQARREAEYRVGYNFGPSYSYVDVNTLPGPVVTQYHLGTDYRYVNADGYVYVVNPHTYRVVRVIPGE